ncbi:cupin, partial [Natronobacterium gregoryi SP2]
VMRFTRANYFELEPGEAFSSGLHTHYDQEEVFYVQAGTAIFDTGTGEVPVEAGEVIHFAPGDFQQGYNPEDAEGRVVAFAFGAPGAKHDWDQIESLVYCRHCDDKEGHSLSVTDDATFELTCSECGNSFVLD